MAISDIQDSMAEPIIEVGGTDSLWAGPIIEVGGVTLYGLNLY